MRISDWSSDVCSSDLPPLVADPTAHPVAPAQLRKAIIFRAIVHDKRHPLVHDTGLVPNHRHLLADAFYLLPMSSDYSVTHLSGSDPAQPSPARGEGFVGAAHLLVRITTVIAGLDPAIHGRGAYRPFRRGPVRRRCGSS